MTDTPEDEMTRTLTLAQLEAKGACSEAVERFRELFGENVDVTVALAEAHAADFDWDWVGPHLLTAPALAEYKRVKAAAWAEYDRVRAAAWAEYDRVKAAAWAEDDRVRAAAWARLYIEEGAE